jgi:hypothetical protein
MPAPVREFYEKARPQGTCRLSLNVARNAVGGPVDVAGHVDLVDARFVFDEFPYPIRQTRGRIEVARDPATGLDWLMVRDVRGLGFEGGPNRDRFIALDGGSGRSTCRARSRRADQGPRAGHPRRAGLVGGVRQRRPRGAGDLRR